MNEKGERRLSIAHRPRVSLGMPVFNSEAYIERALDSVLSQSFEDFELVISDNASTDQTKDICQSYAARDQRIRYVRNRTNYGVVYNFKQVFHLSAGEYFKWAAADDICGRDYLLRAVEVLEDDPSVVLAYGRIQGIDEHENPVDHGYQLSSPETAEYVYSSDPVVRWRYLMRNIWWVDAPFYGVMRSSALEKTPIQRSTAGSDQMLIADLSLCGRFFEIPEILFFNRLHPSKTSLVKTRRERAVLYETDPSKRKRFRGPKVVKLYVSRPIIYLNIIWKASISTSQKTRCILEVFYAVLRWLRRPGRGGY